MALLCAHTAQAAISPNVSVRLINDYGRIFFAWPEKTRLKAEQQGNRITIQFDKAAALDAGDITSKLSPYITNAALSADGKTLTLSTNNPYKIRQFVSGDATGLDILGLREGEKTESKAPRKITPSPANVAETAIPKPTAKPTAAKRPILSTKSVSAEPKPAAKPEKSSFAITPAAKPKAPAPEKPAVTQVEAAPVEAVTVVEAPAEEPVEQAVEETPKPVEETTIAEETAPTATPPAQPQIVEQVTEEAPSTPESNAKRLEVVAEMEDTEGKPFIVTVRQVPRGVDVYFPWEERVATAAFKRENDLWVIFNTSVNVRLDLLRSLLPASIRDVEQLEVDGHTALRFLSDGTMGIAARRDRNNFNWIVNVTHGRRIASKPASATSIATGKRPHVFLPVLQDSATVTITDPTYGSPLMVRPFFDSGVGIYPERDYPQFTLLESSQGLVVAPKDDATEISNLRNGLRISAGEHTALSGDLPQLSLAELDLTGQGEQTTLFPYDSWKVPPEEFSEKRQELERQISQAADIRASSLMLKLAQLYLSEGLTIEALGVLDALKGKDPFFYEEHQVAALHGATYFLMDRLAEAARAFASPELRNVEEMELWNDAMRIFTEGGRPRFDYLDYEAPFIRKYPPDIRRKLGLVAADNYINRKNYSRATRIFSQFGEDGILQPVALEVDYLLGKIASENGRSKSAQQLWEPLAQQTENRFVRARAEYSLVAMLYNNGDIELAEALERLEALRIIWRGDTLELGLLSQIGQLYLDNSEYLNGLRAWDELITYFSESDISADTKGKMAEIFDHLFLDDGADELTPLEALAIFQEFRELIPIGTKGDRMVQKLADRLASVDLLAWAASLLEHQVKFRLEGEARSRVGTRLSLLYLLNKEPEKALQTLAVTGYGANPKALDDERERLTAWAFNESGVPERAIAMLNNDFSDQAKAIRLSIYWNQNDWLNVIESAEELLGSRANLSAPLSKVESEHLLRLAIAYSFENDAKQLEYLREYYSPLLPSDSPNRGMFLFVTDNGGQVDPYNFADVTSQISSIESFMQTYRDQIENAGLSSAFN